MKRGRDKGRSPSVFSLCSSSKENNIQKIRETLLCNTLQFNTLQNNKMQCNTIECNEDIIPHILANGRLIVSFPTMARSAPSAPSQWLIYHPSPWNGYPHNHSSPVYISTLYN